MSAAHPPLGVHLWICPQARHFKGTQTFGRVSRTTISVVRPVGTDRFVCGHLITMSLTVTLQKNGNLGTSPTSQTLAPRSAGLSLRVSPDAWGTAEARG